MGKKVIVGSRAKHYSFMHDNDDAPTHFMIYAQQQLFGLIYFNRFFIHKQDIHLGLLRNKTLSYRLYQYFHLTLILSLSLKHPHLQCEQIGRFLKVLGNQYPFKSSQNIC